VDRRAFLAAVTGGLLAAPLAAGAQPAGEIPRIGFLSPTARTRAADAFRLGLQELGYAEGRNIAVEYRYADGRLDLLPVIASEFVRKKMNVIVTIGSGVAAAKHATATIPIVMRSTQDPVTARFVASLARPGGNITGVTSVSSELQQKRVELLTQLIPKVSAVGILWNGKDPGSTRTLAEIEDIGRAFGLRSLRLDVHAGLDETFRKASGAALAILTVRDPVIVDLMPKIVAAAARYRVPVIYDEREYVDIGGLISYGASLDELHKRLATYVDRILKGAKPADLPVEQPTKFELVINLTAAKALGLTIPPSLLQRADQVIE
jgi:putative ABC transport system substrate-binding protein